MKEYVSPSSLKQSMVNLKDYIDSQFNQDQSHASDTVKHITSTERSLWNTVSNKVDVIGSKKMSISAEVVGDSATAYAEANFVATRPVGSNNLAGFGFHNAGVNGAFLYYGDDSHLHLLRSDGVGFSQIIPFESEISDIATGIKASGRTLTVTWAPDQSSGAYFLRFFIGNVEVCAIKQGSIIT